MLHAYRLRYPDSPNAPEMLWEWKKEHIAFDPSAFAKSGRESVGVARQWCGRLGKVANWQVAPPQAAGKDLPGVA